MEEGEVTFSSSVETGGFMREVSLDSPSSVGEIRVRICGILLGIRAKF
jgi:hypothetical protein